MRIIATASARRNSAETWPPARSIPGGKQTPTRLRGLVKADTHSTEGDWGIEPKSTRALGRSGDGILARRGGVYVRRLFGSGRSGMVSPDVARQRSHIGVE